MKKQNPNERKYLKSGQGEIGDKQEKIKATNLPEFMGQWGLCSGPLFSGDACKLFFKPIASG